jgi:hypothetical protein
MGHAGNCHFRAVWYLGRMRRYELAWWPNAAAAMDALEADPRKSAEVEAIDRVLDALEEDPFNRKLGTVPFQTSELGGVCATPVRLNDWYVIWQRGSTARSLEIILVHQLDLGRASPES